MSRENAARALIAAFTLVSLLGPSAPWAQPTLTPAGGDWFVESSWLYGTRPTEPDANARILSGGTAWIDVDSPAFEPSDLHDGADVVVRTIAIAGCCGNMTERSGALEVRGADLWVTYQMQVAHWSIGTARASAYIDANLFLTQMPVGFVGSGVAPITGELPSASGHLVVTGDLGKHPDRSATPDGAFLWIGGATRGLANGFARIEGDFRGGAESGGGADVGTTGSSHWVYRDALREDSLATGTLEVRGQMEANARVGRAEVTGTAVGTLEVDRDMFGDLAVGTIEAGSIEIGDELCVEDGCRVRPDQYSGARANGFARIAGDLETSNIRIGSTDRSPFSYESDLFSATDRAAGSLTVHGDIRPVDIESGITVAIGDGEGAAITRGDSTAAGVHGVYELTVGRHRSGFANAGKSVGVLSVGTSGLSAARGTSGESLPISVDIGRSEGSSGHAQGTLRVDGDVETPLATIRIGTQRGEGGSANGTLGLRNARLSAKGIIAGEFEGGVAGGRIELTESLVELSDALVLGPGAWLSISIDGDERGDRYSSIDARSASLGGILELVFGSTPAVGTTYDLIVGEDEGSIEGHFLYTFIVGLAPELVQVGLESVVLDGRTREVLRATIVPEPETTFLIGMGLMIIAQRRHG